MSFCKKLNLFTFVKNHLLKKEKLNNSKVPIVPIDKSLEKYRGKVLFPKKLAMANEILAKATLPKFVK